MPKMRLPLPLKAGDADLAPHAFEVRSYYICRECGEPKVRGQPHHCGEMSALFPEPPGRATTISDGLVRRRPRSKVNHKLEKRLGLETSHRSKKKPTSRKKRPRRRK